MKTNSRFIIAFVAAAVTFGSLVYFAGPRHQKGHGCNSHQQHQHTTCEVDK